MIPQEKSARDYARGNEALLRAVPASARSILEVGCGEGRLGARLKQLCPGRAVSAHRPSAHRSARLEESAI